MSKVACVIGAASNLGYQVLKKLTQKYKGKIYFTTEHKETGFNIKDNLNNREDLELVYKQLDVTDIQSIIDFRHFIQDQGDGVDLIINLTDYVSSEKNVPYPEKVRKTLSVNFYGVLNFGILLYPLLNENARVVNVSGPAGLLKTIENEKIRAKISNPNLTEDALVNLMTEYETAARKGVEKTEGWGVNVQSVSKVAVNALTFLQHRQWCSKGIVVNCVNPGVRPSKDKRKSSRVFEEGAKAILYLALEAPLSIKGNFVWSNYSVIEWSCDPFIEVSTV